MYKVEFTCDIGLNENETIEWIKGALEHSKYSFHPDHPMSKLEDNFIDVQSI